MQGNLYALDISETNVEFHDVNVSTNEHLEDLWHQRYGHISTNNLRLLRDQKLVSGIDFQSAKNQSFVKAVHMASRNEHHFPGDMRLELVKS